MTISRRGFLGRSIMAAAAAEGLLQVAPVVRADPLHLPIGFQTYPVGKMIAVDFEGTLKKIAALGYRTVELCSPPSYKDSGFGALTKYTALEMRRIITGAGLQCNSCHYQFKELKESLEDRIAYAKGLGMKQMILSSFGLPRKAGMSDWMRAAGELNKIGDQMRKTGIQLGYHNHNSEFEQIDGVVVYDKLMGELDPKLVKMQFQVAVVSMGVDPVAVLNKYPGRFCSLHLADWSAETKRPVPVGKGVIDWKGLFVAAKKGGVKNYFVEMNMDALVESYPYLHSLQV